MTANEKSLDVIAEARQWMKSQDTQVGRRTIAIARSVDRLEVEKYLDRIEAARKREQDAHNTFLTGVAQGIIDEKKKHDAEMLETVTNRNEFGNAAKLREAMEDATNELQILLDSYVPQYPSGRYINRFSKTATLRRKLEYVIGNVKAALAATPRNCDLYATAREAERAFNEGGGCPGDCAECAYHEDESGWHCEVAWLLDTATPEKGGAECHQK